MMRSKNGGGAVGLLGELSFGLHPVDDMVFEAKSPRVRGRFLGGAPVADIVCLLRFPEPANMIWIFFSI